MNTFSLAEGAGLVGYSTRTLRRAIDAGELHAARQGRSVQVSRVELAKWWKGRGGGDLFGPSEPSTELVEAIRIVVREELERAQRSNSAA